MKRIATIALAVVLLLSGCVDRPETKTPDVMGSEELAAVLKLHCYTMGSMHPLLERNNENLQILRLLFEGLFLCDADQKAQPVLAQGYTVSDDGLLWTVALKEGVTWHDGAAFSAADVVWTYNFVLQSGAASVFYPQLQNVTSVDAQDGHTVRFTLKRPQALFVNVLDVPIVKNQAQFQPIGTGAYCYCETKNRTIYLERYQGWHGQELPNIAHIEVKRLPDRATAVHAYEAREIDAMFTNGVDLGSYASNSESAMMEYPTGDFHYLSMNLQSEVVADLNVRRAIAHSIDKARIHSEVMLSRGAVADACIHPAWWVYNTRVSKYEYDPEKARDRLAGIEPASLQLELLVNADNQMKISTAHLLQEQLAAVGIRLSVVTLEWEQFRQRVAAGNYQMYLASMCYGPDINPIYTLDQPSAAVLQIEEALQQQTGEAGIVEKYHELQETIARELHIIPLYFDAGALLYDRRISGTISPVRGNVFRNIATWRLN